MLLNKNCEHKAQTLSKKNQKVILRHNRFFCWFFSLPQVHSYCFICMVCLLFSVCLPGFLVSLFCSSLSWLFCGLGFFE